MIATHDHCCNLPEHHFLPREIDRNDFGAMRANMAQQLGYPAMLTNLSADHWAFRGAAMCPVGRVKVAHVMYARDGAQLSLFSMPGNICYRACDGTEYDQVVHNHPVAGFVRSGGLYCIVGSDPKGNLELREVRSLRDRLKQSMVAGGSPGGRGGGNRDVQFVDFGDAGSR
jgi:hypothetical protein